MSSTYPIHSIMDASHLTSSNFTNWLKNLKILLKCECIAYFLEGDGPIEPASDASKDEAWEYQK